MQNEKWQSIGGDLEASYDGKKYINIRVKRRDNPTFECEFEAHPARIFISKEALLSALALFPSYSDDIRVGDTVSFPMLDIFQSDVDQQQMQITGKVVSIRNNEVPCDVSVSGHSELQQETTTYYGIPKNCLKKIHGTESK